MAWIRWRETLKGQRLAHIQWRDDLGKVHSKALKTDNEAVAQTYLRAFERSHGARRNNGALKSASDALDTYLDEKRLSATIRGTAAGTLSAAQGRTTMARSDAGSSGSRDPVVFTDEVRRQFSAVLAQAGFTEVRAQTLPVGGRQLTLVEFEGRGVFVEIMQESHCAEISVKMGLTAPPEDSVYLNDWIGAFGGDPDSGWYSASTADRVRSGVRAVAKAFEDYAASRIQSRDDFLLAMNQVRAWQSERGYLFQAERRLSETKRIRRETEAAWRAKDMETVIRLYRQLQPEDLNVVDRKRLALAERLTQENGAESS